jgi:hypothetical protein
VSFAVLFDHIWNGGAVAMAQIQVSVTLLGEDTAQSEAHVA